MAFWRIDDLREHATIVVKAETREQAMDAYLETLGENVLVREATESEVEMWGPA